MIMAYMEYVSYSTEEGMVIGEIKEVEGTSADQDTRFSNKQAKLMKSHKFPIELEHLVDMTKVKLEVMKPWIANRVTELIGFEDEVLINFIYTLLDGKVVNGKEVQISLTGFMERNTGKFMKELWLLLLSAQHNISGVPQQFLDAKEEETRKKQVETDRIANEIEQKKEKEKQEREGASFKKMDGDADNGRASSASLEQSKRHYRTSSRRSEESDERSGSRGRNSGPRSPIYFRRRSPPVPRHQHRNSPFRRRRSPSPLRHRSPTDRRRSVSPVLRRSRSPQDLSSPSAAHQSSPSPIRRSPVGKGRSPARSLSSPSAADQSSPSPIRRSPEEKRRSPTQSPIGKIRYRGAYSPRHNSSPSEDADRPTKNRRGSYSSDHQFKSPESSRSSQRDSFDRTGSRRKLSPLPPPPHRSPSGSESPPVEKRGNHSEKRSKGSYEHSISIKKTKMIHPESLNPSSGLVRQKVHHDSLDSSMDDASTKYSRGTHDKNHGSRDNLNGSSGKVLREDKSPEEVADHTGKTRDHFTREPKQKVDALQSERPGRLDRFETSDLKELPGNLRVISTSKKGKEANDQEGDKPDKTNQLPLKDIKGERQKTEVFLKSAHKGNKYDKTGPVDSRSDDSDKERVRGKDKRKRKKSETEEVVSDDDSSSDSYIEDRKEAKRRRKEEKKSKKEERRRKREERQKRKEERRTDKRRRKLTDATAPPDDERIINHEMRSRGMVRKEADPKELEIALREKALESLRAKKGVGR